MVEQRERLNELTDGGDWLALPFDRAGNCIAPQTRAAILQAAAAPDITDVLIFSHGWNNDRQVASERYQDFIDAFRQLRSERELPLPEGFNPLLVGLLWPSTTLVFGDERVLAMAGERVDDQWLAELTDLVASESRSRFRELASRPSLSPEETSELAALLPQDLGLADDEAPEETGDGAPLEIWRRLPEVTGDGTRSPEEISRELEDFGRERSSGGDSDLAAAGDGRLDPRKLLRVWSVRQMKDRAGVVGSAGVARFLEDLLGDSKARVHLIGHSYGARVVLSALCASRASRKVESMLLLQPAVSHLCFADPLPGTELRAGFADAPGKVNRPILATFSSHDRPLRKFFHLALWRKGDLGELSMAAEKQTPKYGALGGYGPSALGERAERIPMRLPPGTYDVTPGRVRVIALNGEDTIHGHGDVINEATSWALYNLLR